MLVVWFLTVLFEIEGVHLSKNVWETISMTNQCLPSLFFARVPSNVETTVFNKYELNDCKSNDYLNVRLIPVEGWGPSREYCKLRLRPYTARGKGFSPK